MSLRPSPPTASRSGLRGIYRDVFVRPGRPDLDRGWTHNLIVERCRALLAAFMAGEPVLGVQALHLGRGDVAWDAGAPPPAPESIAALIDPTPVIVPVAGAAVRFLDAVGNESMTPTARIEITLDLGPGTPPPDPDGTFPLREFGLFGEIDGAPAMIDYVRHPVMHKGPDDTLVRTIRLEF